MELRQLVEQLNEWPSHYHRIDFGDGIVLDGQVDPATFLDAYCLPSQMEGLTVLDVGAATGFFSLECAKRGASVTAIDVFEGQPLLDLAASIGVEIRFVERDIYDLDEQFGTFDLVICGSLLLHLPDLVGAMRALRQVSGDRAVVSTACMADSEENPWALFDFAGARAKEAEYSVYWVASAVGLQRVAEVAGFETTRTAHFTAEIHDSLGTNHSVRHVLLDLSVKE